MQNAIKKATIEKSLTLLVIALSIIFLVTFLSCKGNEQGNNKTQTSPPEQEKISIRLKWIHQGQFAGFYCAAKQKFFSAQGIEAQVKAGGQDFNAVKMVASGSDDFGVWGADQLLIAREKEIPVVAIAVIYPKSPACFTTLNSSNIKSPNDFVGRNIGMQYGTALETVYIMMLNKVGIDRSSINEIPVQFNFQMLLEGKVDAWPSYAINEPILAREKGFDVNIIDPANYGVRMYADTVFTTEKMIKDRPDLVQRTLNAIIEGWRYAIENPEKAAYDLKSFEKGIEIDHQIRMIKAAVPYVKPTEDHQIGTMNIAVWQEIQAGLMQQGLLNGPINLKKMVNNKFVEAYWKGK